MRQIFTKGQCLVLILVLLLGALGGAAWVYRSELMCWYCLNGLANAAKEDRDGWITRLAELDSAAVPGLLDLLGSANGQTCANAEAALSYLVRHWGAKDLRTLALAGQLVERFSSFSPSGQEAVLEWQLVQLKSPPAPRKETVEGATRLLAAAFQSTKNGVRQRTLALAGILLEMSDRAGCLEPCRELVRRELKAPESQCRVQAVRLTLHPDLQKETGLLRLVVPLLQDEDTSVRHAAVLSLGMARDVIAEDDLLPLLHDPNKEVRRVCELALKQRGLSDSQILLGKLIHDARPLARLQIVEELPYVTDLDPAVWLQRLSKDASEAVRAGAARAMANYPDAELRQRLKQMAKSDPSPTVRQNAGYYLTVAD